MAYTGWELPEDERQRLLQLFEPRYPDVIAHHITHRFGVAPEAAVLPPEVTGKVVGIADDGEKVQALVISIDGRISRPDGNTYHCTWSLDRAQKAKPWMSNEVIEKRGYHPVMGQWRTSVRLVPKIFA